MRHIFRLCASGMGPEQIAKRLEQERILVPTEYAYRKFGRGHSSRNPDFPYRWSGSSVADILETPDYIGIQTSCKTHKPSYKSDLVVEVPEEERYRVENAHEPIIDRELWDIVQRVRENKRRPTKLGGGKWICWRAWYSAPTAAAPITFAGAGAGTRASTAICAGGITGTRKHARPTR